MSTSLLALAALVAATFAIAAVADTSPPPSDPDPSPTLTPAQVVRLQVEALQANDQPTENAGIATAFRFASPGNRATTGPLSRFTEMIEVGYSDMLGFERAEYGAIRVEGDQAVQLVTLVQADGQRSAYAFGLSRQRGGACDGCWMTDAVMPVETDGDTITA